MTIFEPCVALAGLGGAIAGGMAGSQGGVWSGILGMCGGGIASVIAAAATVGMLGVIGVQLWRREDQKRVESDVPPASPSRLHEIGFLLFISPVVLAPVWAPLLVYRIVSSLVGSG